MLILKLFFLKIFVKLYYIYNINFLRFFIKILGGPLFVKLLQNFNNLKKVNIFNNTGTIGCIIYNDNIVTKKLHHNINKNIINSLKILELFLEYNRINFPFYYKDFYDINIEQLDMTKEAKNSFELARIFKNINNVKIINIFESDNNYHKSYLINGFTIDIFFKIYPDKRDELIMILYLSYYLMLLNNFFHCDWHFGNFLVAVENNKVILYILDTGLIGSFSDTNYKRLKSLLKVNLLLPKKYNIIKFLIFLNSNKNVNIDHFLNDTNKINSDDYNNDIIEILNKSGEHNLKFPIIILYMFQGILFINNLILDYNVSLKDIKKYSETNKFHSEILKVIR